MELKKYEKRIVALFVIFIIIYGIFSFITLEPDFRKWEAIGRIFFVTVYFVFSAFAIGIISDTNI